MFLIRKALVASAIFASIMAPVYGAESQSVQIKFHGKIVDTTCKLSANTDSVELGTYPVGFFTSVNSKTEPKSFELKIAKCQLTSDENYENGKFPASRVYLSFSDDGTQNDGNRVKGLLNRINEDDAKNVAVQVQYEKTDGQFEDVFDTESTKEYQVSQMHVESNEQVGSEAENTIRMQAMMSPTNSSNMPSSGDVNAQMTVTLTYQ